MKGKIKLSDVARCAGVAVGTASRVLNNRTDVNPEARERVLAAVAELGYSPLRKRSSRPNHSGPATSTGNIGVVVLGMDASLVNVPVMVAVLNGVESGIAEENRNLLFANLPRAERVPGFLKDNLVEGLIVKTSQYGRLPPASEDPLVANILRFPVVWVLARPEGAPGDLCSFNHETAALLAARHFRSQGHRLVAFCNPKKGKSSHEHLKMEFAGACRGMGLRHTLLEAKPARAGQWPEPALSSAEDLAPLVTAWKKLPAARRPTALFVPADNIAAHLYAALAQQDIEPGRDVGIIGCNNELPVLQGLRPRLTTIDIHAEAIGRKSVEQLLWRLSRKAGAKDQTLLFEPELVEGDSVPALGQPAEKKVPARA
ncbi:MAG: LacI family DNA-binding transcriptional regulator [Opitutales bacterium]|nr:LacI family DNA-binding transcriptional regulator [Opitutales bacterium]